MLTKQRESWSTDEHERFIEALRLYNRDWKKIEAHVGTKTVIQARGPWTGQHASSAQHHFAQLALTWRLLALVQTFLHAQQDLALSKPAAEAHQPAGGLAPLPYSHGRMAWWPR